MINPVLNIAPPAQSTTKNGAQTTNGFGAVLARQMDDKAAAHTPVSGKTPDSKATKTVKSTDATEQANQDQLPVPDAATNPLAALLLGNQTIKTAVTASNDTKSARDQPSQTPDAATVSSALLPGNPDIKVTTAVSAELDTHSGKPRSAASVQPSGITRDEFDPAVSTSAKTEQAVAVKPGIGTETFKVAELAASLPTPSPQVMAQSATSQVASGLMSNLAMNSTHTTIAAPLGSRAWPDEFAQKISWVSTQQNQVAELHLNPPDLGPMSVVLTVSDNQATALFTSPHSAVREAIENALPKLRESLADNGIMLGNATVSDQPPHNGGSANFTNQRSHNRTESGSSATTEAPPTVAPLIAARRHNGMVDTFA